MRKARQAARGRQYGAAYAIERYAAEDAYFSLAAAGFTLRRYRHADAADATLTPRYELSPPSCRLRYAPHYYDAGQDAPLLITPYEDDAATAR